MQAKDWAKHCILEPAYDQLTELLRADNPAVEAAAFEDQLSRILIPTLILFGAHDKVVPPGNADLLAEKIANSKVVIFPDAGHFFPIEIPQVASEAVIQFAR